MLVDTHVHTSRYSPCSTIEPVALVQHAANLGLSGIALVEHHRVWSEEDIEKLRTAARTDALVILRGQEIASSIGHLVVYGYYGTLQEGLSVEEILLRVHGEGGVVIVAHPFRNRKGLEGDPLDFRERWLGLDGMEVYSSNHTESQNEYAKRVCEALGWTGVGGSDAHSLERVGTFVTVFENAIRDDRNLIEEIRAGRCRPMAREIGRP